MTELEQTELEQILATANAVMVGQGKRYLSDVETAILMGAIADKTYEQIAEESGYSINYIKRDIGPKLWRQLSVALGEKVSKTNFQQALKRYRTAPNPAPAPTKISPPIVPVAERDWGEAPDVSFFLGRTTELETLRHWMLGDRCRLVALLGMGGIGKTTLSVKVAEAVQSAFDLVIWRSLRNAPPLDTLLAQLVPLVSQQQDTQPTLNHLLPRLQTTRCLLVLDNVEAILQPQSLGHFRPGYEDYEQLLQVVGDASHQSCVVLTSREKPIVVATREGAELPVRSLTLSGLQAEADAILAAKGLEGSSELRYQLIETYGGNPLAIKIAATSVQDLFNGDIGTFLTQGTVLFNGVRQLLEQQFERLSPLEQTLMYWLAINREWTTVETLHEDVIPPVSRYRLLEALEALCRRNLIEQQGGSYTQQPVVMEYVCDRLVEQMVDELTTANLKIFTTHALLKTTVAEYIRESQTRLLLEPVGQEFCRAFPSAVAIERQLLNILAALRHTEAQIAGYGGGNLLNLCNALKLNLTGFDFSRLTLQHTYLQATGLRHVNLREATFIHSVFTELIGLIFSVDFSPDGDLLATGDFHGEICVWQTTDYQKRATCKDPTNPIWSVAYSPIAVTFCPNPHPMFGCDHVLASSAYDGDVRLWDADTGKCLAQLSGHRNWVVAIAWSPDGSLLASGSHDQTIRLWDPPTGQVLHVLEGHTSWVWSVAFSPDGRFLASASEDQTVRVWEVATGNCIQILHGHRDLVWSVAFQPEPPTPNATSGSILASAGRDATIKLWEVATGRCLQTLPGHTAQIWSLAFSPDGRTLASTSADQTIRLWDTTEYECHKVCVGHRNGVRDAAFSPDGQTFASGSHDQTVKLWDIPTGQCLRTLQGLTSTVISLAFSPAGDSLASGHADQLVRLWSLPTGRLRQNLSGHLGGVESVAFHPHAPLLASGSHDGTVRLWHQTTGHCQQVWRDYKDWVRAVVFSPDGQWLATSSDEAMIRIWDVKTGKLSRLYPNLSGDTNWIFELAWSPDSQTLACGGCDHTLKLVNVATGACLATLEGHKDWVVSVAWHPTRQLIATGSLDQTIRLWDLTTGQCIQEFASHIDGRQAVAWHPEGNILAMSKADATIQLWDITTDTCIQTLAGQVQSIQAMAWSSCGRWLASGHADGSVILWDRQQDNNSTLLTPERLYEGMNITGVMGISDAQRDALMLFGAVVDS
ncbi:MAG: NB-ARC domain-containing protein [Cyanobacteria bacterium J06638_20]